MADKDYSVQLKVRNGRLLTRMRAMGIETVAELCRAAKIHNQTTVGQLLNLKISALKKNEEWRSTIIKISDLLRCMPEDIVPEQHRRTPLGKNTAEFEIDADQIALLTSVGNAASMPDDDLRRREVCRMIDGALQTLTAKQERILRLRYYEDKTLKEIGDELGVSTERIRQQEAEAIRRLRHPDRANKFMLRELINDSGE